MLLALLYESRGILATKEGTMSKELWVIVADGFEEIEALTPVDCLRRVGASVRLLSLGAPLVTGARGIVVKADDTLANCFSPDSDEALPDAIILPGGLGGAKALAAKHLVGEAILAVEEAGGLVAAICAAPALVLAPLGLLDNKSWTCYPGMEEGIAAGSWSADRVVLDGQLITARGPGCAAEFSLAIVEALYGSGPRVQLANAMVI